MAKVDSSGITDMLLDLCDAKPDSLTLTMNGEKVLASFTGHDKRLFAFEIGVEAFSADISFESHLFDEQSFSKWISQLEYEFEQRFKINVKVAVSEKRGSKKMILEF